MNPSLQTLKRWVSAEKKCIYCNKPFKYESSFGQMECKHHDGALKGSKRASPNRFEKLCKNCLVPKRKASGLNLAISMVPANRSMKMGWRIRKSNEMIGGKYLADTNAFIYLLQKHPRIQSLLEADWSYSFITEIELLGKPGMSPFEIQ